MRPGVFYLAVAALVACDQVSKATVMRYVPGSGRPILEPFFSLTPTRNPAGAFSLLQAHNWVFVTIAVIAIGALIYAFHTVRRHDRLMAAALSLALSGAIGNLLDRAQYGYVRDFFHIHTPSGQTLWPIFNVADSAITVAIVLLFIRALWPTRRDESASDTPESAAESNGQPA
ncbi:MAG: signal peptidase II [Armatimonadetes bacterium]|nr:signal peptidase II [Armatimonadota bacterium]